MSVEPVELKDKDTAKVERRVTDRDLETEQTGWPVDGTQAQGDLRAGRST